MGSSSRQVFSWLMSRCHLLILFPIVSGMTTVFWQMCGGCKLHMPLPNAPNPKDRSNSIAFVRSSA
jgi:hypothetical protein